MAKITTITLGLFLLQTQKPAYLLAVYDTQQLAISHKLGGGRKKKRFVMSPRVRAIRYAKEDGGDGGGSFLKQTTNELRNERASYFSGAQDLCPTIFFHPWPPPLASRV